MRITDLLAPEAIELGVSVASKPEAIEKLISLHDGAGNLNDVEVYREAILAREAGGTTAIGEGMAIPHAKTDAVKAASLVAVKFTDTVEWASMDGEPIKAAIALFAPASDPTTYLGLLSKVAVLLHDEKFRAGIFASEDVAEIADAIAAGL